ncbi:MAG: hypothetical protein WBM34_00575 [Woeseiaceae bacterium]
MIDLWLLVLIVLVGMVVAIEGIPDGFARKAKTFVVELAAAAQSMIKRVASMTMVVAKRIGQRIHQSHSLRAQSGKQTVPAPRLRVAVGAAVAVVLTPFAAIPMTFVFALLLYALNLIGGDEYDLATNAPGTLRYILGYTFVIWVATVDVISRWSVITLPFFIGLGFIAAYYASRSNRFVRKLVLSTLIIGVAYPLLFLLGAALDVFHEPIFN